MSKYCPIIKKNCIGINCALSHDGLSCSITELSADLIKIANAIITSRKILDNLRIALQSTVSKPALGEWSPEQVNTIVELLRKIYPNGKGGENK